MNEYLELIEEHDRDDTLCLKCLAVTDFYDFEIINGNNYILWKCPRCKSISKSALSPI